MAHASGTRTLALVFLVISVIPPWIQAVVTLPIWYGLLRKAKQKEREQEELHKQLSELSN